jgi:hypothetical protein
LEVPGISPAVLLGKGISFGHGFGFGFGEGKDEPEFLFEEEHFFDRGSLIEINHLGDEKMFFLGPSVHMFEESPFHLPEFFPMEGPALSLERFSELDESVFKVVPEPLHDMEMIILKGGLGPNLTDHLREGRPEVEDDAVGFNAPGIKLSEKPFSYTPAVEPGNGFDIEDSNLDCIPSDLFISASSSRHVFIDREGS